MFDKMEILYSRKSAIKRGLASLGFLESAQKFNYWLSRFDKNTKHPKRQAIRFYSKLIKKGDLCFDIGANIGSRTELFIELGASVICVEPQPSCIESLTQKFESITQVKILEKAVSSEVGIAKLLICDALPSLSTLSVDWTQNSIHAKEYNYKWLREKEVCVTTLDALIKEYGKPDFIKIDIENFEVEALQGLNIPVDKISFEFNSGYVERVQQCLSILDRVGSYHYNFALGEPTSGDGMQLDQWTTSEQLMIVLRKLQDHDTTAWGDIYAILSPI